MVKINLNKIPSGNIYIRINKKLLEKVEDIIEESNTILPDSIKSRFYGMKNGQKGSLKFIKGFSLNLEIPIKEFERNIDVITSVKSTEVGIKNPKIPINFASREGVRFIASIMGDGELNNQLNVRYNNQNKNLIDIVLNSSKKLFGDVDYKIYYRKDKIYQLHFPKIVGIIVKLLGIKPGYKSKTNYGIPSFIFNLNRKLQSIFVRQFFNDEGNVRLKDRRLQVKQTININVSKNEAKMNPLKYAPNSLIDLQKLLHNLGIESKISLGHYRIKKADWELSIYRIENLKKFQKQIGFDLKYKSNLLDKAIKSYKFPSAPRNGRIEFALKCAKKAQKKYGFITKYNLARISNRSLKTATYYLVDLKKKNLVYCFQKPKRKKGGTWAHKYKIISLSSFLVFLLFYLFFQNPFFPVCLILSFFLFSLLF